VDEVERLPALVLGRRRVVLLDLALDQRVRLPILRGGIAAVADVPVLEVARARPDHHVPRLEDLEIVAGLERLLGAARRVAVVRRPDVARS
jgi:hypothetical protein